jgi:hypothetical protein
MFGPISVPQRNRVQTRIGFLLSNAKLQLQRMSVTEARVKEAIEE